MEVRSTRLGLREVNSFSIYIKVQLSGHRERRVDELDTGQKYSLCGRSGLGLWYD
jgi:hypothetical protein